MLAAVRYNLANLFNFRGRETRALFWPYAGLVFVLTIIGIMVAMLPRLADSMTRMQRFAAEHPEQATVQSGPGTYSITIHGNHPELMPDMAAMMTGMDFILAGTILLLAAAVVRRLHDRGRSGWWGLMPIPFLAFASFVMPKFFAQSQPDMGLFLAIFFNNLLYLVSLGVLIVMLAGASLKGDEATH